MREKIKTSLKTGAATIAVTALAMGGIALAQTDEPADPGTTDSTTDSTPGSTTGPADTGDACRHPGRHGGGLIVATVVELTGLTADEVVEQLRDGSTVADIAAANGSSAQAVIDAAMADVAERLDEEVAAGELTRGEADEKLAEATERITAAVNGDEPLRLGRGPGFGRGLRAPAEDLAAVLGLTVDELREARRDGLSLADIAGQQGVAIDDLVAVMIAPLQERLDEEVADGDLTREEADERLAEATERITESIENDEPGGFGPGRRRGPRGGGFGPGFAPSPDVEDVIDA